MSKSKKTTKESLRLLIMTLFLINIGPSATSTLYAAEKDWAEVGQKIEIALKHAVKTYESGKNNEAMEEVSDAYFGLFESETANMEIAVRRFVSFKVAVKLEKGFNNLRKSMHQKREINDIRAQTSALLKELFKAAEKLDRKQVGMDMSFN